MMNEPQVSFITVCYNGFKDTCELIESLQTHVHSVSYEIIVVDNASHENEAAKIHQLYPTVQTKPESCGVYSYCMSDKRQFSVSS